MARAWVLNLDADDELACPDASPTRAMRERVAAIAKRIPGLVPAGDLLLADDAPRGIAEGRTGLAWCPTPRALACLEHAGAIVSATPPIEVIRRVNHRAFTADLGTTLPASRFARSVAEVMETIAGESPTGLWLLKRAFGFAGRGHMRVRSETVGSQEIAWIKASVARDGGLQVEPLVARRGDFALHGFIDRRGAIHLGEPTRQACDERGIYRGSERAAHDDLAAHERTALVTAALEAGKAAFGAGYTGPFGIDAFRFEDAEGSLHFNPRCELNARYTMGWAIGMGDERPDLDDESDPA